VPELEFEEAVEGGRRNAAHEEPSGRCFGDCTEAARPEGAWLQPRTSRQVAADTRHREIRPYCVARATYYPLKAS
jgi:hypothetical protein